MRRLFLVVCVLLTAGCGAPYEVAPTESLPQEMTTGVANETTDNADPEDTSAQEVGPTGSGTPATPSTTQSPSTPSPQPSQVAARPAGPAGYTGKWQTATFPEVGVSASFPGQPQPAVTGGVGWRRQVILPDRLQSCDVECERGDPVEGESMEEWWKKNSPSTNPQLPAVLRAVDLTTTEISLNGHPGREFTYKTKGVPVPFWERHRRIYYVNGSTYTLAWNGPEGRVSLSDARKFFDSFRLLDAGTE